MRLTGMKPFLLLAVLLLAGCAAAPDLTTASDLGDDRVDCAGIQPVPVARLSSAPGVGSGSGQAERALAAFLQNNPWAGNITVQPTGWVQLAESPTRRLYGHRSGPVGVDNVVAFELQSGTWTPTRLGGDCGLRVRRGGLRALNIYSATDVGSSLEVHYEVGSCGGPEPQEVLDHVDVSETADGVHVTVWVRHNPAAGPVPEACAGVGLERQSLVALLAPLGTRVVLNDGDGPERLVPHR